MFVKKIHTHNVGSCTQLIKSHHENSISVHDVHFHKKNHVFFKHVSVRDDQSSFYLLSGGGNSFEYLLIGSCNLKMTKMVLKGLVLPISMDLYALRGQRIQWWQALGGRTLWWLRSTLFLPNMSFMCQMTIQKNTLMDVIMMRVTTMIRLFFTFIHALCLKIRTRDFKDEFDYKDGFHNSFYRARVTFYNIHSLSPTTRAGIYFLNDFLLSCLIQETA